MTPEGLPTADPPGERMTEPQARLRGLSVFLPAYNEEGNLQAVVEDLLKVLPDVADAFEVLIVNDGSQDGTAPVADGLAATHRYVRVVHHPRNLGYGAALRSGIAACRMDYLFFTDTDRQFDVGELPLLVRHAGEGAIVIGYRIDRQDPWRRRLTGRGWTFLVRALCGLKVRDMNCAFKLFPREAFDGMCLETTGLAINAEILTRAQRAGFRFVEVGVHHFPRRAGRSAFGNFRVIVQALRELWPLVRG